MKNLVYALSAATVSSLHGLKDPAGQIKGVKAICYISAGTYENWRPDATSFPVATLGSNVTGWAGERWLDIRNQQALLPIMQLRMSMCKTKGFDAVDFDNVDGYSNATGFPLTAADQISYDNALASYAHGLGLATALKNNIAQLAALAPNFDMAVNEQCNQYSECMGYDTYFINAGKPVFNIEYNLAQTSFCPAMNTRNFNSNLMGLYLDGGRKPCR